MPLLERGWVPIKHNVAGEEANLHARFHRDASSHLATIHQRHRQTDRQDRQQCDSIEQTVLQTVAQEVVINYFLGRTAVLHT